MINNKKIDLIIFISSKNNNNYERKACIFYDDYTLEYKSYKEGQEELIKLLEEEKINVNNLKNYNKVKFCTKEDFLNKYKHEIDIRKQHMEKLKNIEKKNQIKQEQKLQKKETKIKNKELKKEKKEKSEKKGLQRFLTISIVSICAATIGIGTAVYNKLFNDTSLESNCDDDLKNTNGLIKNPNKIINLLNDSRINKNKKKFVTKTVNYLYNYNKTNADKYAEKNTTVKAAHRWDEIVSQQLIFNNYNKQELGDIFDYYDLDSTIMYNAYLEGIKQESMLHIIQTSPLEKTGIISKKANKIYKKYEELNIKFNIQFKKSEKKKIAKEFFKELREDINFEDASDIETYKTSILPIVDAMMKKCKNIKINGMLNKKEKNWFYNSCIEKAENKLTNSDLKLEEITVINNSLNEKFDITFEDLETVAMESLEKENLYNVSNQDRNLTTYDSYKKAILKSKSSRNDNNYQNYSDSYNNYTDSDSDTDNNTDDLEVEENDNTQENNKNSKTTSKKTSTSKKANKNNKTKKNNDNNKNNDNSNDNDNDSDSIDYNDEEETDYYDNDYDDSYDYDNDDEYIEEDNQDMPKQNEYKDVTDDPTGAVDHNEPLPDPNSYDTYSYTNEEIADIIIEKMTNDNTIIKQTKVKYKK